MGRAFRIVVALQPGAGHWARTGAIAEALVQRGHRVTIAASASFLRRIDGAPYEALIPVGPDWTEDGDAWAPAGEGDLRVALRDHAANLAERFFDGAPEVADDLKAAFGGSFRPDLFVFDYTLFGGPPAAEMLGVPWAACYGMTVPFRPSGWPPFGSHEPFAAGLGARLRHRIAERRIARETRPLCRPVVDLWRKAGVVLADPWRAFAERAALGLVGSLPEADFPWLGGIPERVRYVGPLIGDREMASPLDDPLRDFLADAGPLVHVSLGLTFSRRPDLLGAIAEGLADLPCRVLIGAGLVAEADWPPATSRRLIRSTVPHWRVFPHLDALVCHGGANTLMKALAFGVPALIVPLGADQRGNGARFRHAGLGSLLLPGEANPAAVRAGVAALLDPERGYRGQAAALAVKARAAGGPERAARLIEDLCLARGG